MLYGAVKNENLSLLVHQLEVILLFMKTTMKMSRSFLMQSLEKSPEKGRSEDKHCLPDVPLCNQK